MDHAVRLRVTVLDDHTVQFPEEVPTGEVEVIVLIPAGSSAGHAAVRPSARLFGALRGAITVADDFDAPLPESVLRDFEGSHDP